MKYRLCYIVLVLGLLSACGGDPKVATMLSVADSLMADRPDSALAVLEGVEGQMAGESRSVRMRYQLLRHKAMNKAYVPFTSDSLMLRVTDYYDSHGTANERMEAHYLLGCVYRDMEDAPKALTTFHEAIDCADTSAIGCDFILLCKIHGQIANLLLDMQLPYEALDELKDAGVMAHHARDTLMEIHCKTLQTHGFYLAGQLDSVIAISEQQSKEFLQYGDSIYSLISLKPALCAYIEKGELLEAQKAMKRFDQLCRYDSYNFVKQAICNLYAIKGQYFLLANQLDSSRYYFERASENSVDETEKVNLYKSLARYYAKTGQPDSTIKYSEKYVSMDDTVYRSSVRKDFQEMHTLYNYERNKRIAEHKAHELSELKSKIISYALFLSVIIMLAISYIAWKKRKMDDEHRELNTKYTESLEQYSILKKETELLEQSKQANEMLIGQLEQEKELHAEAISKLDCKIKKYASTIKQNKESMKKQEYLIASFQKDQKKPGQWKLEESLFNLPILTHLHKNIAKGLQPSDAQLEEIRQMVETMLPGYIPKIKELYPQINQTNLMFCIVAKLRFINSERAVIFNMSPQSVTNRCAFLYNKLTGKKGGAVDFESEIQRI